MHDDICDKIIEIKHQIDDLINKLMSYNINDPSILYSILDFVEADIYQQYIDLIYHKDYEFKNGIQIEL